MGELDLHLGYLQADVKKVLEAVANMATKQDLQAIEQRMNALATKEELAAVKRELQGESVPTIMQKVGKGAAWVTKVAAAGTVVAASGGAVAHWMGWLPK